MVTAEFKLGCVGIKFKFCRRTRMKKEITIDGSVIDTIDQFYDEVEKKLTGGLDWTPGRNLDTFSELLRGGFGVHNDHEPIIIRWIQSARSRETLGKLATIDYLHERMKVCHADNVRYVQTDLDEMTNGQGLTLFEEILAVIDDHDNVDLRLL